MVSGYRLKERAAILLDDFSLMTPADPKLLAIEASISHDIASFVGG
jgi:hypothetical protein